MTTRDALDAYARAIGLAFQIQDDLLDVEGDATLLGKATGADQRARTSRPIPSVAGVEAARQRMHELHARALARARTTLRICDAGAARARCRDWLVLRKY